MTAQITVVFNPPLPTDAPDVFDTKAFDTLSKINTWAAETNELADDVNAKQVIAVDAAAVATDKAALTAEDAIATAADRVKTGQDKVATDGNREQTGLDRIATEQNRVATAADRVRTGEDRQAVMQALESIEGGPLASVNGKTGPNAVLEPTDIAPAATEEEMREGLETEYRSMSPASVAQAIASLASMPSYVLAPSNALPLNGSIGVHSVILTGSPYYSLYGKPQKARQARMSLSPAFDVVAWDSGAIVGADVNATGPNLDGLIPVSTVTYWQMRYQDADGQWSEWSPPTSFTTAAQYPPTVIGQPFGGGFYAGKIKVGADTYVIITAPKSAEVTLAWKPSNDSTPGTTSTADGFTNSNAMNNASHPAAKYCRDYRGGGHDDWYLPAKSELELEYRAFKPDATANSTSYGANPDSVPTTSNYTAGVPAQTTLPAFKTGGAEAFGVANYYWSSTESSASTAWYQVFSNGHQDFTSKNTSYLVRPLRRLKI